MITLPDCDRVPLAKLRLRLEAAFSDFERETGLDGPIGSDLSDAIHAVAEATSAAVKVCGFILDNSKGI